MDQDLSQLTHELRRHVDAAEKMVGMLGGMIRANRGASGASNNANTKNNSSWWDREREEYRKSQSSWNLASGALSSSAGIVTKAFNTLGKDAKDASWAFQSLAKALPAFLGGAALFGVAKYAGDLSATYKELSEAGQRFGGDIFGMAKAATESQLSLEEYARIMKGNSAVAAALNKKGQGFGQLTASLRHASEKAGMFGYTIEGMNDLAGDYMETMRLQGRLENTSTAESVDRMMKLAQETTALSSLFGKSRKDITADAQSAMRDGAFASKMRNLSPEEQKRAGPALESAITQFAAQTGDAGKMLSRFLAQTEAYDGDAHMTDTGKMLNSIGLGQLNSAMSKLDADLKNTTDERERMKLVNEFNKTFGDTIDGQERYLRILEKAGNANAGTILRMRQDIGVKSDKELDEAMLNAKAQKAFTQLTGSFTNMWNRFSKGLYGSVLPIIEAPLEAIAKTINDFTNDSNIEALGQAIQPVAKAFADFLTNTVFTQKNFQAIGRRIKAFADTVASWFVAGRDGKSSIQTFWENITGLGDRMVKWFTVIDESDKMTDAGRMFNNLVNGTKKLEESFRWLYEKVLTPIANVFQALGRGVQSIIGFFSPKTGENLSKMQSGFGDLVLGLGAAYAALKVFQGAKFLANLMSLRSMRVNARTVHVHGGGGMLGGGGGGRGGRGGKGRFGGRLGGVAGALGTIGGLFGIGEEALDALDDIQGGKGDVPGKTPGANAATALDDESKLAKFLKTPALAGALGFVGEAGSVLGKFAIPLQGIMSAWNLYSATQETDPKKREDSMARAMIKGLTDFTPLGLADLGMNLLFGKQGPGDWLADKFVENYVKPGQDQRATVAMTPKTPEVMEMQKRVRELEADLQSTVNPETGTYDQKIFEEIQKLNEAIIKQTMITADLMNKQREQDKKLGRQTTDAIANNGG